MISIKERELIVKLHEQGKNQQEIASLLGCSQPTVHKWLLRFKRGRTLHTLPRSGRPTKLSKENLSQLKDKILVKIRSANSEYCSVSTKQVKKIVHQEVGEDYSMRHIERIMHRLGFSLITPRPQHLRHDQEKVDNFRDEFKKKLRRSMWVMN
ncbi:MAG: winged helix-turn-helix domain-containing protein [archaeon]